MKNRPSDLLSINSKLNLIPVPPEMAKQKPLFIPDWEIKPHLKNESRYFVRGMRLSPLAFAFSLAVLSAKIKLLLQETIAARQTL